MTVHQRDARTTFAGRATVAVLLGAAGAVPPPRRQASGVDVLVIVNAIRAAKTTRLPGITTATAATSHTLPISVVSATHGKESDF